MEACIFFYYVIFLFLVNVIFFYLNKINEFFRICVLNLIPYFVFNSVNVVVF